MLYKLILLYIYELCCNMNLCLMRFQLTTQPEDFSVYLLVVEVTTQDWKENYYFREPGICFRKRNSQVIKQEISLILMCLHPALLFSQNTQNLFYVDK